MKKAAVTIMAKATPAIINLLFISKLKIIQLKSHSISVIRNEHKIWKKLYNHKNSRMITIFCKKSDPFRSFFFS